MLQRTCACLRTPLLLLCLLACGPGAYAQDPDAPEAEPQAGQSDAEKLQAAGQVLTGELQQQRDDLTVLNRTYVGARGEEQAILWSQIRSKRKALGKSLEQLIAHAGEVEEAGLDATRIRKNIREQLNGLADGLRGAIEQSQKYIITLREKRSTLTAEELDALDKEIEERATAVDEDLAAFLRIMQLMQDQGIDTAAGFKFLDRSIQGRAEHLSGVVQYLRKEYAAIAKAAPGMSEEEKQARNAELAALDVRIRAAASHLNATVAIMKDRELETSTYTQLLIQSTGELTEDIFQTEVALGLLQSWLDSGRDWVLENGPRWIFKVIVFLLILVAFRFLAGITRRLVRKAVTTSRINLSQLLQHQVESFSGKVVMFLGLLVALSQLGIQLGPVLAGLGIAGFIIGFALQDTLSNFAAGMMILIYRPYDVEDAVEAGGVTGKVKAMNLVSTTITTWDNQKMVVPNSRIWGDVIRNITAEPNRRVDMTFGIAYADDIDHAERVLQEIVANHELVLADPEPVIKLHTLGESSVDFVVRPWANTEDYWTVYWDITRAVKKRFDAEGISIPFPQRDVHLIQEPAAARPA